MIFIGIGTNLAGQYETPLQAAKASICALSKQGVRIVKNSSFYTSPPMGPRNQPFYVNAVIGVQSCLSPVGLLRLCHRIEADFGRKRGKKWHARPLDLDILDWHGRITAKAPQLPHIGITKRAFVLLPLREIAPHWRHPATGQPIDALIRHLPPTAQFKTQQITELHA